MGRFINPFTDVGFKIIFEEEFSKPHLLDFLNALLVGEKVITDITFLDKEQPALYDGDRSPIYDVLSRRTRARRLSLRCRTVSTQTSRNVCCTMPRRR